MTIKLFRFAYLFAIVYLVTACSKETNKAEKEKDLNGTWQWVRADGGIAYHIHETPVSTGKNIDLKITSDNRYYIYTNGSLTSEGTYSLDTRKCIHDYADKTFINFSLASDPDMMVENADRESLELSDEAYDGIERLYKRKYVVGH